MALRQMVLVDFVIVSHLSIDWQDGFSVLTGETGAGKSILIDALQLALGGRASSGVVRHGASRADITAVFDPPSEAIQAFLHEAGMSYEAGEELLLRRQIDTQGKSRAWINGITATTSQLRALSDYLVDIHGQHAWQSLTKPASVRHLLDSYAKIDTQALQQAWKAWSQAQTAWEEAEQNQTQTQAEREQLQWHLQALDDWAPVPDEWEELQNQQRKLAHAQTLVEAAISTEATLRSASLNATDLVDQACRALGNHIGIEPTWQDWLDSLHQAQSLIADVAREAQAYGQHTQADPASLALLDERIAKGLALARRLKCQPEELVERQLSLRTRLGQLNEGLDLEVLRIRVDDTQKAYQEAAKRISLARQAAAPKLAQAVTEYMQALGMAGGCFAVQLMPINTPTGYGLEDVQLAISAHAGLPLQALAKTASGGELSRLALAVAVVTAQTAACPTLIFDEIDVGIGGQVAHTVGHLMRTLGQQQQVLAVTHLAQVAAYAHHHHVVHKHNETQSPQSQVQSVTGAHREAEIARMMGGHAHEPTSLAHARSTLAQGQGQSDPQEAA
jgi:DNA repair protein RecN (Recombination protein N)